MDTEGILNPEVRHLTRSLMTFEELESFIDAQNAKLAKSNRFLCATVYNPYQYMVMVVKTSMNLNQDIISALPSRLQKESRIVSSLALEP